MVDEEYRVVLDGIGRRTGTVPGQPQGRDKAMAGFDTALDVFADDIGAGDMRVSVLAESEYLKRGAER